MPDSVPRLPKTPPDERIIPSPFNQIKLPPDFFPSKPDEMPEIQIPASQIRRPPMAPPIQIIDRAKCG